VKVAAQAIHLPQLAPLGAGVQRIAALRIVGCPLLIPANNLSSISECGTFCFEIRLFGIQILLIIYGTNCTKNFRFLADFSNTSLDSLVLVRVADPDLHFFGKLDPDPH
jgi:hypothetical protein